MKKIDQQELYEWCERLYEKGGQSAVIDFVLEYHHEQPWDYCQPCEVQSPVTAEAEPVCLVCGTRV